MNTIPSKRQSGFSPDDSIEITIAPNAGACFGVVRAIKLGHQALKRAAVPGAKNPNVYSFGPLIHNPKVVKEFEDAGVKIVNDASEVVRGTVVLRSHGVQKTYEKELRDRGVQIVDATCPLVKKPQRIATSLGEDGYFLILVGDPNHPEVKGVVSYFGKPDYLVTYQPEEVLNIPESVEKVGIIAQTTIEVGVLDQVIEKARARFKEVAVYNTICDATSIRQTEALNLARTADIVIVVGGKNSSNTCKLVKICKTFQQNTYHIEEMSEIDPVWFVGKRKIGVTGGASTPHENVDSVGSYVASLLQSQIEH